jgi:uncharacterized membrane protein YhaH (DUF805 family)
MNMEGAVRSVLSKYGTILGRAARPEYWWWVLAVFILLVITRLIDGALIAPMLGFERFEHDGGQPLSMLVSLAVLLPGICVAGRRLHDLDKSAWWLLMGFIPVVGFLVLLWFFVQRGSEGANQFG